MLEIIRLEKRVTYHDLKSRLTRDYGYRHGGSTDASLRVLKLDEHVKVEGRSETRVVSFVK